MNRFAPDLLKTFIASAFQRVGMPEGDARIVAELMVEADLQGSDGHGIFRLPQYIRRIQAGGVNLRPDIRIERERTAMAVVNGDKAPGHLALKFAAEPAIRKRPRSGPGWVGGA